MAPKTRRLFYVINSKSILDWAIWATCFILFHSLSRTKYILALPKQSMNYYKFDVGVGGAITPRTLSRLYDRIRLIERIKVSPETISVIMDNIKGIGGESGDIIRGKGQYKGDRR